MSENKKILLINIGLEIGGIEISMVNMANELCKYYDVDVLFYNPDGPLKENLDSKINIIKPCFALKALGMSPAQALKSKSPLVFLSKMIGYLWSKIFDNRLPIFLATLFQKKLKGYDLAIAYRSETRKKMMASGFARVLDRCVQAKTKAVWLHYDAIHYGNVYSSNTKYYKKVDKIVGVSQAVAKAFQLMNPEIADKVDYCYNFLNHENVLKKSLHKQGFEYPQNEFICFSAIRLAEEKAVLRAISAISPTLREYNDVKWYIAGDGPERADIEQAIKAHNLTDKIILLGNQNNPYAYMRNSDLLMLLSYHEAAPVVYMEAHTLGVPVFSTRTISADEMLDDGVNAFICENSEEGIRDVFADLMANRNKITKAKEELKNYKKSNEASLKKIRELVEGH